MPGREVKLSSEGRNPAAQTSDGCKPSAEEASAPEEGQRPAFEPASPRSLLALLATLEPIDEEFPPIEELPY